MKSVSLFIMACILTVALSKAQAAETDQAVAATAPAGSSEEKTPEAKPATEPPKDYLVTLFAMPPQPEPKWIARRKDGVLAILPMSSLAKEIDEGNQAITLLLLR